jgi:hypothetical protein
MSTVDDNIFSGIDFEEGSDNPWGLESGTHKVSISNTEITRSEKGNLGLWLTFSDDEGKTIRKWTTMPEPEQDIVVRKRNTSFLRVLLNNLEIPRDRWEKLEPDDFIDLQCVIIVKPQANNSDYYQVSKITRDHTRGDSNGAAIDFGTDAFKKDDPPTEDSIGDF